MPLTFTVTEGVLPAGAEQDTFAQLSELMLQVHHLEGSHFLRANLVGSIHVLSLKHSYSGVRQMPVAFVEWKVPLFAFTNRKAQSKYVEEATEIVHAASGGRLPKAQIWINVVHAVDGIWGIAGRAYTNEELSSAIAAVP